ncbi:MAG: hypothetical protein RR554_08835 [Vagococcus sp.]|uniref:hypothetical protein n=1 Tax=Vagococcus sp. TaxID=1933889 RepID=UPI002FCBA384
MEELGIWIAILGFCFLSFRFTDYINYLSKWQKLGLVLLFIGLIIMVFFNNSLSFLRGFIRGLRNGISS